MEDTAGWSAAGAVSELAARIPAMDVPPQIGDVLPRADTAWHERVKLEKWILAERGHGLEWHRVFHVGVGDSQGVWEAIALAARGAVISTVRDHGSDGIVCDVEVDLTIGERTAPVTISWHYTDKASAPRLVTAYVTL
jgi:hypothetical protein